MSFVVVTGVTRVIVDFRFFYYGRRSVCVRFFFIESKSLRLWFVGGGLSFKVGGEGR